MKNLTNLEQLEHVLNVFSKRLLPAFLFVAGPQTFIKWQGNICKQTALMNVFIINHFLGDEYKVEAWEGFFEHEKLGSYNHCWNYLVHKDDPKKNIICDFTSTISYMNYSEENDPMLHLVADERAVVQHKTNLIAMEELNIEEHLDQPELFTGLTGRELEQELTHLLKMSKLWPESQEDSSSEIYTESTIIS